ncbi:MAG: penicillin-binding protein 2 [Acidimicrobiales bacterium]
MTADSTRLRMGILGVIVISLFAAMLTRLWYLQVLAAPTLSVEAQNNSVRLIATEAPRGRILDRNGKVIVDNRVVNAVTLSRDLAERGPEILARLSPILGVPVDDLIKRVRDDRFSPFKPVPLVEDVAKEKLIYIKEHQNDFPGVDAVQLTKRNYPNGIVGAHLLGYVGQINDTELEARKDGGYKAGDTIGKSGVEQAYESDLRGEPAVERLEIDSKGQVLRTLGVQPAVQGHDLQLSVDLDVQALAEESLQQGLEAARGSYDGSSGEGFKAPAGSVVVLDPSNGSVVAMASYPSFDPKDFVDGISQAKFAELQDPVGDFPLNNRALQGLYAPGSTFKLVTGLAALEKGMIGPRDTVADPGMITVGGRVFKNARSKPYGNVDVTRAMAVSSDVFFYRMGEYFWENKDRFGATGIQDVARRLGLGSATGVDLPYEAVGRVPDPEGRKRAFDANPGLFMTRDWFTGDNMNMAVGQGDVAVSPMQLANAYATFANGGTVYAPRVASAVLDANGQVVRRIETQPVRRIDLPPTVRDPILAGFKGAVADVDGTAYPAFQGFPLSEFAVAGKTGTAEVAGKQDSALFSAFAPADAPKFQVTVVMEQSGFGASAAAPVARRVLEKLAGVDDVQPVNRVGGSD